MVALPAQVLAFLREDEEGRDFYRPSWLLNAPEDPTWHMKIGGSQGRLRESRICWDFPLPTGNLCDGSHELVRRHAKMLLLAVALDGRMDIASLGRAVTALLRLVEFAAIHYPEAMLARGLHCLGIDDAVEIAVLQRDAGAAGVGQLALRWERWLGQRLTLASSERRRSISAQSHAPDESDSRELTKALLAHEGAFGRDGRVKASFVATAIGVSVRRVARLTRMVDHELSEGSAELNRETCAPGLTGNRGLCDLFIRFGEVACSVPEFHGWEFSDVERLSDRLAPARHDPDGRTKTIPLKAGLELLRNCLTWTIETSPALEHAASRFAAGTLGNDDQAGMFGANPGWPRIGSFWPFRPQGSPERQAKDSALPTSLVELLALHVAVVFVLTAALSCSRKSEVLDIVDGDLTQRDDRHFLRVHLRKTGAFSTRRSIRKPIPPVVANAIRSLVRIRDLVRAGLPSSEPSTCGPFFCIKRTGISPLFEGTLENRLRNLTRKLGGSRHLEHWTLSPHQLRRFFAMTFFHHGGNENALPALSWFMGHDAIAQTWRYIKECMTGSEITEVEAALAVSAVLGAGVSENVERLRTLLRAHFGQDDLWMIDEEQVEDYLLLLRRRGDFTASPRQIRTTDGVRHTVLIHFERLAT